LNIVTHRRLDAVPLHESRELSASADVPHREVDSAALPGDN
jgi:hypothetical protein